ncbi:unknown [Oscillibacter sp. CAG:155]|nr:hypothetical protein [uncultured Oscillibacter sp.]CDC73862.1 unknown [Oscillibacter sp. CAG:155]
MATKTIRIRTTSSVRRVGSGIQIRTTVSNGKTTKTRVKTIYPR